jgi:hypothetical protein
VENMNPLTVFLKALVAVTIYLMLTGRGTKGCIQYTRLVRRVDMPRATVLVTPERKDLTTLPAVDGQEGGWVELRRLSWGEKLQKDAEAMRMKMVTDPNNAKDMQAEISMVSVVVSHLEFSRCIIDHNLEDDKGRKLDLRNKTDIAQLDPRVGQEISDLIGEMNDFERASKKSEVDDEGKS